MSKQRHDTVFKDVVDQLRKWSDVDQPQEVADDDGNTQWPEAIDVDTGDAEAEKRGKAGRPKYEYD